MNDDGVRTNILVIDDDLVLNKLIVSELDTLDFITKSARSWKEAESYLNENEPDLVLLDIRLPDADGMDILPGLLTTSPVLILTAYGSIRAAVDAMKLGAAEYLVKPVDFEELELVIRRVLGHVELQEELKFVRSRQRASRKIFMIGNSNELQKVSALIDAVAREDMTVLITGESGVGKELVAKEVHEQSARSKRSFVALDCCTLQENLFESELFGHEKGAFTGATQQKKGLIEGAKGGTLFLDEIGEIGPAIQAKLLRVLETGIFRRLGGNKNLQSNVRILAATNQDLKAMVQAGQFRTDLYYRLAAFVITVPPLRKRRSDIPGLVEHFINKHNFSRRISKKLSKTTLDALISYDWPGNVRELRNVIERAIIISGDDYLIQPGHLGFDSRSICGPSSVGLNFDHEPTFEEIKSDYLRTLYEKYNGHRGKLAKILDISERNLYRLLKKQGLK
jgi:DNA-binding NtrC family response regulator